MNKTKMLEFLGKQAVEEDGGWSEEAWSAGYSAAVADAIDMFTQFGSIPFDADEVVDQLEKLR
jgi:hypothetical protein